MNRLCPIFKICLLFGLAFTFSGCVNATTPVPSSLDPASSTLPNVVQPSPTMEYIPESVADQPEPYVGQDGKLYLDGNVLLDPAIDAPGCFGVGQVSSSPDKQFFIVVMDCIEGDNDAFLFLADGSKRMKITGEYDYLNYYNYEWSPDGRYLYYTRINSCCKSDIPPDAPPPGRVRYDLHTSEKVLAP